MNIKEKAKEYEPTETKNVADLERVPIEEVEVLQKEATDKENNTFKYNYFEYEGVDYRVPNCVLRDLKEILKITPDLKYIKVIKSGEGMKSKYQVLPIQEEKQETIKEE